MYLQKRPVGVPIHRISAGQVRSLWWWSRYSTSDEALEDRMRRHHKMMRYRYSKAVRRRAMWDSGNRKSPLWGWKLPGRWLGSRCVDHKNLSCNSQLQANVHDRGKEQPEEEDPWEKREKEFEKFKEAVDRAIDRDPFGTLFGRHLRSPPSANNSSWTSFSWIFEPLQRKGNSEKEPEPTKSPNEAKIPEESPSPPEASIIFAMPPPKSTTVSSSSSVPEESYEIDPITMRKVPKEVETQSESPAMTPPPKKPFLQSLFAEHGVEIPVKTYKPHKIYGHTGSSKSAKDDSSKKDGTEKLKTLKKGFESSRMRELNSLKAITIGNSIDTTAEFHGKFNPEDPPGSAAKSPEAVSTNIPDDAPLFSGTTYESKANDILASSSKPQNDWLVKEGFRTASEPLHSTQTPAKIQPSLDRLNLKEDTRPATRLISAENPNEKLEDVDLLRASDVRAAAKTVRKSKEDAIRMKHQARQKLETDFEARQSNDDTRSSSSTIAKENTEKANKGFSNIWKHVSDYPQGIVARTMEVMGLFNSNQISSPPSGKPRVDPSEKLIFQDENLSKTPSIYKKVGKKASDLNRTFTPSQEVINAEVANKARTTALRQANDDARALEALEQTKVSELADQMRAAYEESYGQIDINHRQPTSHEQARPLESTEKPQTEKLHPLQTATVRSGVVTDPVIDYHVDVFEPRFAELVDQVKVLRAKVHESHLTIKAWRSKRPMTHWNSLPTVSQTSEARSSEDPAPDAVIFSASQAEPSSEITTAPLAAAPEGPHPDVFLFGSKKPWVIPHPWQSPFDFVPSGKYLRLSFEDGAFHISSQSYPRLEELVETRGARSLPDIIATIQNPGVFLASRPFRLLLVDGWEVFDYDGVNALVFRRLTPAKLQGRPFGAAEREYKQPVAASSTTAAAVDEEGSVIAADRGRVVRRQEDVFSGPRAKPLDAAERKKLYEALGGRDYEQLPKSYEEQLLKTTNFQAQRSSGGGKRMEGGTEMPDGLLKRFARGVTRVVLTAVAMAGFAYGVGVASESLGAQGAAGGDRDGLGRKRVVGVRPGIYSTESSRD